MWGVDFQEIWHGIKLSVNETLVNGTKYSLEKMMNIFNSSVSAMRTEVAITPNQFDSGLVDTLRELSTTVVLPIAALLITYIFVLQIIEQVTNKNKGGEWDSGSVIMLIIKTFIVVSLTTNAFTISLAFADLSTWMIKKVPTETVKIENDISNDIVSSLKPVIIIKETGEEISETEIPDNEPEKYKWDYKIGQGLIAIMISIVSLVVSMGISATIYLVAWSRIILIYIYVTISPIPFSTLMTDTWASSIGQNFLKNLMALTLQGFLMMVLLVIYKGLLTRASTLISAGSTGIKGIVLIIVAMAIVAKMLIGTHTFAKSIVGAS